MCSRFHWDLSNMGLAEPRTVGVSVRYADEDELGAVAQVFYEGLRSETSPWSGGGSPWDNWLASNKLDTIDATAEWFRTIVKQDSGKILLACNAARVLGLSGFIMPSKKVVGLFTGIVVLKEERRKGIGSFLLYKTLVEAKRLGADRVEVSTIPRITAAKYLYPKYGGVETHAE